jgi:hypothetical protein
MHEILQELNAGSGWDWCIKSYDGWKLQIWAGNTYYSSRPAVMVEGVSYLNCPVEFDEPIFRLADVDERAAIARLVLLDEEDIVVAIEAKTMAGLQPNTFFIVGESWTVAARS